VSAERERAAKARALAHADAADAELSLAISAMHEAGQTVPAVLVSNTRHGLRRAIGLLQKRSRRS
jgi:hypothetical protein